MGVNNVDYTLTAMMFSTRRDICKALLLFNESDVEGKDLHSTKMYKYFKYLILSGILHVTSGKTVPVLSFCIFEI